MRACKYSGLWKQLVWIELREDLEEGIAGGRKEGRGVAQRERRECYPRNAQREGEE